jgi:hypothetical protein
MARVGSVYSNWTRLRKKKLIYSLLKYGLRINPAKNSVWL